MNLSFIFSKKNFIDNFFFFFYNVWDVLQSVIFINVFDGGDCDKKNNNYWCNSEYIFY